MIITSNTFCISINTVTATIFLSKLLDTSISVKLFFYENVFLWIKGYVFFFIKVSSLTEVIFSINLENAFMRATDL